MIEIGRDLIKEDGNTSIVIPTEETNTKTYIEYLIHPECYGGPHVKPCGSALREAPVVLRNWSCDDAAHNGTPRYSNYSP